MSAEVLPRRIVSSPKLPQAPGAFQPGVKIEKEKVSTCSLRPVLPLQAQNPGAQTAQPSPKEPSPVKRSAFYASHQQAVQPQSKLPTLSFPSGEELQRPSF